MRNSSFIVTIFLCVLFSCQQLFAQTVFRGTVLDQQTKKPIEAAKIGISGQGVGVLSNEKGLFVYKKYDETLDSESQLTISAPGYESIYKDSREIRTLWNSRSTIYLVSKRKKKENKKGRIKDISVFWDASLAMRKRDINQDIRQLKKHILQREKATVRLVVFNEKVLLDQTFDAPIAQFSEIQEVLENVSYKGGSNYSLVEASNCDEALFFSNGRGLYGTVQVAQNIPVYCFVSGTIDEDTAFLNNLANYTSGANMKVDASGLPIHQQGAVEHLVQETDTELFMVKGQITSTGSPLQGASIVIGGTFDEFFSKEDGSFEFRSRLGTELVISHLGMYSKKLKVDGAHFLEIELIPENDVLDEVVLKGKKSKAETYFENGMLLLDGLAVDGPMIGPQEFKSANSLVDAVNGIRSSVEARVDQYGKAKFIVRGEEVNVRILGDPEIPLNSLNMQDVERIFIKKTKVGLGPEIIVVLKSHPSVVAAQKRYNERVLLKGNDYTENLGSISKNTPSLNELRGVVSGPQGPIQGATIIKKGSFDEYTSQADGTFSIPVEKGDVIQINYLGMYGKGIVVQDTNKNVEVTLLPKNDVLDEVVLNTKKSKEGEEMITTATGKTNKERLGFAAHYLDEKDIPATKNSLIDILNGRFAGVRVSGIPGATISIGTFRGRSKPPAVVIDGVIFEQEEKSNKTVPDVPAHDIKSITILKGLGSAMSYGPAASGGAVVIELKSGISEKRPEAQSLLVKGNEYSESVASLSNDSSTPLIEIKGIVTGPQGPIQGATITRKGSFDEFASAADGSFVLKAQEGDVLMISYLGMFTKAMLIEDIDKELSINLVPQNDVLDEVVLNGSTKTEGEEIVTGYGKESKDKLGYATGSIASEDIKANYQYLSDVLRGQISGVQILGVGNQMKLQVRMPAATLGGTSSASTSEGPIFVVDNVILTYTLSEMNAFIDPQNIANITVLKSLSATNRYGSLAVDGAVVIKSKTGDVGAFAKAKTATSPLVSGNEYQEGTVRNIEAAENIPSYIQQLNQIPSVDARFKTYQSLKAEHATDIEFYVDMSLYFKKYDSQKAKMILSDLALKGRNNVKILRTVAYIYESLDDYELAQKVYQRILRLEPKAAQSYRDLAMAYQYTGAYNQALELYINMLGEQIKGVNFDGLEKPLRSELSRLVTKHKDKIDFARLPNQWLKADFKIDVRMVVEWSDRSAPFEFQFVNPQKKYYNWTHDLLSNRERLEGEQKHGYQTEEFVIDDAPSGEWLVNIQYLGNEGDYVLPPFMKYTIYKNYGTLEETKEVRVVKLFRQLDKVTLGKVQI